MILEEPNLYNKEDVFQSRKEAGIQLGSFLEPLNIDMILAIPNGGIPVVQGVLEILQDVEFNLLFIRKIQLPLNTESGFGAVTPDGQLILNDRLIQRLQLREKSMEIQIERAKEVLNSRRELFDVPSFEVKDKIVALVDDGIASGYSMIAGVKWLEQFQPKKIIIAVPTGPKRSLSRIMHETSNDDIVCLNVRSQSAFAVADAYQKWYDVSDKEALSIVKALQQVK